MMFDKKCNFNNFSYIWFNNQRYHDSRFGDIPRKTSQRSIESENYGCLVNMACL